MNLKKLVFNMYKVIYYFPFNNLKRGKVQLYNFGAILINCKIKSTGTDNEPIMSR